jgi:threonine synthase
MYNSIYYSTNFKAPAVSFREALLGGLAPDKGLYLPVVIPEIPDKILRTLPDMDYASIANEILRLLLPDDIDYLTLKNLCNDAYNFAVPLENVYERKYILRLDHGPTASFKDFAARVMGRLMQYYLIRENKRLVILTATSGDTGSAVANAFYGLHNIKVVILYPEKEVSAMQRKQMTTLKNNINVISIKGKFDDCQLMVKQAFSDPALAAIPLSSANSINIGRLLPQSVYYFYAWAKLSGKTDNKIIFSVPSGNFGNLMGGLIAQKMGLPVSRFVIATNENDEVPEYFKTGIYRVLIPSKNCISSAMNVGHPSNMARIITLYGGRMNEAGLIESEPDKSGIHKDMYAVSITEQETMKAIKDAYSRYGLLLEPHGAVAWEGLHRYLESEKLKKSRQQLCVSLETAHPAKFPAEIREILNIDPELPDILKEISKKTEEYITLDNNYIDFRNFISDHYASA